MAAAAEARRGEHGTIFADEGWKSTSLPNSLAGCCSAAVEAAAGAIIAAALG